MTLAHVFLSRPAVLTPNQDATYDRWLDRLGRLGFAALTIPRASYTASPWSQLRKTLDRSNGAVILGFRQSTVERGQRRPGTPEETSAAGWYASPWNQIEAGLAAMADLPVLVVPECNISEGVFAADVWREHFYGTTMDLWISGDGQADPAVRDWAAAVRKHAEAHRSRQAHSAGRTSAAGVSRDGQR